MSLSPRPARISMNLPWRMPCCAAPAPEPHEPDTARPHTSPPTSPTGGGGNVRSKSGRLDAIRHVIPTAVDPDFCATVWTGSRHACPGHLRYGGQYAEMAWTPEAGAWP